MQHPAPVLVLFVVPVHHHRLVALLPVVLVVIFHGLYAPPAPHVLHLVPVGVPERFDGHHRQAEKVPAVLDVLHPRLPEQVQQVHAAHVNVPRAVVHPRVPENALHPRAKLELVPPHGVVHRFIAVFLQHHRQNVGQLFGLPLIVPGPGQHHRLGIVVHGVRVLVQQRIEQPRAGRAYFLALAGPPRHFLPVPQLPPLFIARNAAVQHRLALLVAHQPRRGLLDVLHADPGKHALFPGLFHALRHLPHG